MVKFHRNIDKDACISDWEMYNIHGEGDAGCYRLKKYYEQRHGDIDSI